MSVLAAILLVFGALAAGFHASPDRWARGSAPSRGTLRLIAAALAIGLAGGLAVAVAAQGWAVGIATWLIAVMVAGVAVVALASFRPLLARQLAGSSFIAAALLVVLGAWGT